MSLPEVLGKWMVIYLPDAKQLLGACLVQRKHKETKSQNAIIIKTPAGHHVQTIMVKDKITVEKLVRQLDPVYRRSSSENKAPQAPWQCMMRELPPRIILWRGNRKLSMKDTVRPTGNNTVMRVIRPIHTHPSLEQEFSFLKAVCRIEFCNAFVANRVLTRGSHEPVTKNVGDILVAIFGDSQFHLKIGSSTFDSHFDGIEHVLFPCIDTGLPLVAMMFTGIYIVPKTINRGTFTFIYNLLRTEECEELTSTTVYSVHNGVKYISKDGVFEFDSFLPKTRLC